MPEGSNLGEDGQRLRIARNAERCTSWRDSVYLSVRHVSILYTDK